MTDNTKKQKTLNDLRSQLDRLGYGEKSNRKGTKQFSTDEIRRAVKKQNKRAKDQTQGSSDPGTKAGDRALDRKMPDTTGIIYRRDIPRRGTRRWKPRSVDQGRRIMLEKAVKGREIMHQKGKSFLIVTSVDDLGDDKYINNAFREKLLSNDSGLYSRIHRVCDIKNIELEEIIFLDLETTGLSNSPLFLIGTMTWEREGFEVQQFLARNYAEESAAIALFLESCIEKRLLVTFNGKSYDFPFLRTRAAANGIPFTFAPAHFDLLHECRRIWKDMLPDCRLQTLEKHICSRMRYGDIPGSEIPDAYHAYVRTENARQIVEILKHNMLDLITLADLMTKFPQQ